MISVPQSLTITNYNATTDTLTGGAGKSSPTGP